MPVPTVSNVAFMTAVEDTYTGHVEALQDDARLRTDVMKVFADVGAKAPKNPGAGGATFFALGTAGFGAGC